MSNISTKINLAGLKHSIRMIKGKTTDIECLVIPIEPNKLFKGEKGIYLDLTGFEIKNKVNDSKDTHLVKQSLAKEVYEKMNEEEKRAMPVLGSHILWGGQALGDSVLVTQLDSDDLPF